jgi:hypothetical protein
VRGFTGAARRTFGVFGVFGMLNALNTPDVLSALKRDKRSVDETNCMRHQPDNIPVEIVDKGRRLSPGITNHHLKYRGRCEMPFARRKIPFAG